MLVGIAADHGAYELKQDLVARLHTAGHEVSDFGPDSLNMDDDYPDYVIPLARAVVKGRVERGVAVCGSGVGASVCANKIAGVRAALVTDPYSARQGVEHDHLNIICMGGRTVGTYLAWELLQAFLRARYSRDPRHLRRLAKVTALEPETGVERTENPPPAHPS